MNTATDLTDLATLQEEARRYTQTLLAFFQELGLADLLQWPVDHLAIKAKDSADFEQALQRLCGTAVHVSYTHLGGRRLAAIQLAVPIRFGVSGETDYLELMEPRPDRAAPDLTGLDHIELRVGPLEGMRETLARHVVPFRFREYDGHSSLVLPINPAGQEVKFTDNSLRGIIAEQIRSGESVVLKG